MKLGLVSAILDGLSFEEMIDCVAENGLAEGEGRTQVRGSEPY